MAASAERCASARTSDATTAKPRPASPARAASTPAFSASRLVWNAISSITPMIWLICCDDLAIASIASTASRTTTRALLGVLVGRGDDLAGMARAFGRFLDGRGDLVERRGGLLEARGLLLGAARQIVGGRGISFVPGLDRFGALGDPRQGRLQLLERAVEIDAKLLESRDECMFEAVFEVVVRQLCQRHLRSRLRPGPGPSRRWRI